MKREGGGRDDDGKNERANEQKAARSSPARVRLNSPRLFLSQNKKTVFLRRRPRRGLDAGGRLPGK